MDKELIELAQIEFSAEIADEQVVEMDKQAEEWGVERLGDHCLNSTISELRAEGYVIHAYAEQVQTRFGRNVRVKRYFLIGAR